MAAANPGQSKVATTKCVKCDTELHEAVLGGQCPVCIAGVVCRPELRGEALRASLHVPAEPIRYLGDYEILEEIGQGGMGIVYKARQLRLRRIVALKVIAGTHALSPRSIERFHAEAEAAASLAHPNIVPIFETGAEVGRHYFSMKLIEGETLAARLDRRPPAKIGPDRLCIEEDVQLVGKVAVAVHYAHQHGILHRDLKPANILLDSDGEPHISDFGLAKHLEFASDLTLTGEIVGTPAYMAPEQAAGKSAEMTTASDVFSLGAILYELVTGQQPFHGGTSAEMLHHLCHEEPQRPRVANPNIPRDLETICLKCLEKEPGKRYASAQAFADDLGRFQRHEPIRARAMSSPERLWRWSRRKPALAFGSLLLLMVTIAGLAGILWQSHRADENAREARTFAEKAKNSAAEAREKELFARQSLYAADMNLASRALESDNLRQAQDLLSKHIPAAGELDLRGFEWRYLWKRCQGDHLFKIGTYKISTMNSATFAPGRHSLITTGFGTEMSIWDIDSRKEAASAFTGQRGLVLSAAPSPDGRFIATAASRVIVSDAKTLEPVQELLGVGYFAAFSPDGMFLLTLKERGISIWETGTWAPVKDLEIPDLRAGDPTDGLTFRYWQGIAFFPDSRMLAIALEKEIRILTVPDLREVRVLPNSRPRFKSIAISPDGRRLAVPALNNRVSILELDGKQSNRLIGEHSAAITDLSFTADGKRLITSSFDQTLKIWDVESGTLVRTLRGHTSEIFSFTISSDDHFLASVSAVDGLKVWDLEKGDGASTDLPLRALGFDSEGNIVGNLRDVPVSIDPASQRAMHLQPVAMSVGTDGLIEVPAPKLAAKARASVPADAGLLAAVAPNGEYVLCRNQEKATVWRVNGDSAVKLSKLDGDWYGSGAAEFSPDSRTLAMITSDSLIRLYSMPTAELFATLSGHTGASGCLSFSPDGKTLASTADDGSLRLWHLSTGREMLKINVPISGTTKDTPHAVKFSPDGRSLVITRVSNDEECSRLFFAPSFSEIAKP